MPPRRRKSNPIPPGTVNVSVNMPLRLREALQVLADRSSQPGHKISVSQYCKQVLVEAVEQGHLLETERRMVQPPVLSKEALALNERPPEGEKRAIPKVAGPPDKVRGSGRA